MTIRATTAWNNQPLILYHGTIKSSVPLWFVRQTPDADDFWMLIESCRRFGATNRGDACWYDVVAGPVARSFKMRTAHRGYDQISFHTDKAVAILDNSFKYEV